MALPTGTDFVVVANNTIKPLPYFAVGQLNCSAGTFTVQPILPSDLASVEAFCEKGKFLTEQMKSYLQLSVIENPFCAYAVRSPDGLIQAILCLKRSIETRSLSMKVFVEKTLRQKQLGTAIWSWTVEQLFPMLAQKNLRLGDRPFLESNLTLKGLPNFLEQKALGLGFAYSPSEKTHSIVLQRLIKPSPRQEDEKRDDTPASESAPKPNSSWFGKWWP